MKKESKLIEIDSISYKKGDLEIGVDVIALTDIMSNEGNIIEKGSKYKVIRLLNQFRYPGGFVINYKGQEWGFYIGEGSEWWGIVKKDEDDEEINIDNLINEKGVIDRGISEFETIPYSIYSALKETVVLDKKALIEEVIFLENPSSSSRRNIKNTIEIAINNLIGKGYLAKLRSSNSILLTPQGREFFEKESIIEEDILEIDNDIIIRELGKGKTIIVDTPELIEELKKYPDTYFLVENNKGTYDLGALYDDEAEKWVVARKYKREI